MRRNAAGVMTALVLASTACALIPIDPPAPAPTPPPTTEPGDPSPEPPGDDGWQPLFVDDFDTVLDTSRWAPYHSTYGDGNQELACLTPDNVIVAEGVLSHVARREVRTCPNGSTRQFTSGFIGSRETGTFYPLFARYEIRARLPHGQGLWPAFWLRHRNGASTAEVDVMEYFHSSRPGEVSQALHLPQTAGYNVAKQYAPFEEPTTDPAWHTFAVEITPVGSQQDFSAITFRFFVDGTETFAYTDADPSWATSAPADASWDVALNLAVGGRWTGGPDDPLGHLPLVGRCAQSGTYPNCSSDGIWRASFPATYSIDWVKVSVR